MLGVADLNALIVDGEAQLLTQQGRRGDLFGPLRSAVADLVRFDRSVAFSGLVKPISPIAEPHREGRSERLDLAAQAFERGVALGEELGVVV